MRYQDHTTLNILIVYCHPESTSFNVALRDVAIDTIESLGHLVEISDLYGEGFDPVEKSEHYQNGVLTTRFEPLIEHRHACGTDSLPADMIREIDRLDRCGAIWSTCNSPCGGIYNLPC